MPIREGRNEFRLGPVRVLEFVHQDVAEPSCDRRPGRRRRPDEAEREGDLVAEVDAAVRGHERLVGGVGSGEFGLPASVLPDGVGGRLRRFRGPWTGARGGLRQVRCVERDTLRVRHVLRRRDVLVLASTEQRRQRREEPGRVPKRTIGVQLEFEEMLAEEDDDLWTRQDSNVRG